MNSILFASAAATAVQLCVCDASVLTCECWSKAWCVINIIVLRCEGYEEMCHESWEANKIFCSSLLFRVKECTDENSHWHNQLRRARNKMENFAIAHTHTHVESTQNSHTHRRQSRRAFAIYFPLLIDFIAFAINEYRMSYNKNTENEKKTISSSLVKKKKKLKRDESEDEFNNLLDFARNREEEKKHGRNEWGRRSKWRKIRAFQISENHFLSSYYGASVIVKKSARYVTTTSLTWATRK